MCSLQGNISRLTPYSSRTVITKLEEEKCTLSSQSIPYICSNESYLLHPSFQHCMFCIWANQGLHLTCTIQCKLCVFLCQGDNVNFLYWISFYCFSLSVRFCCFLNSKTVCFKWPPLHAFHLLALPGISVRIWWCVFKSSPADIWVGKSLKWK